MSSYPYLSTPLPANIFTNTIAPNLANIIPRYLTLCSFVQFPVTPIIFYQNL